MTNFEIVIEDYSKLKKVNEFQLFKVNTNGGMGGVNYTVIGKQKETDKDGFMVIELPIRKTKIRVHPTWVSVVENIIAYAHGKRLIFEYKGKEKYQGEFSHMAGQQNAKVKMFVTEDGDKF